MGFFFEKWYISSYPTNNFRVESRVSHSVLRKFNNFAPNFLWQCFLTSSTKYCLPSEKAFASLALCLMMGANMVGP